MRRPDESLEEDSREEDVDAAIPNDRRGGRRRNRVLVSIILFLIFYVTFSEVDDGVDSSSSTRPNLRGGAREEEKEEESRGAFGNRTAENESNERNFVYVEDEEREDIVRIVQHAIQGMGAEVFLKNHPNNITGVYRGRWRREGPSFVDWSEIYSPSTVNTSASAHASTNRTLSSKATDLGELCDVYGDVENNRMELHVFADSTSIDSVASVRSELVLFSTRDGGNHANERTYDDVVVETPTAPDNSKRYTPTYRIPMRGVYVRPYNEIYLFSRAARVRVAATTTTTTSSALGTLVVRPERRTDEEDGGETDEKCIFQLRLKIDSVSNKAPRNIETSHYVVTSGTIDSPHFNATIDVSLSGFVYDQESFHVRAKLYALVLVSSGFAQALAMIHQMHVSGTQAGAARISVVCLGTQAILDAYASLAHVFAGIVYEHAFQLFVSVGFLQFVIFAVFDMRFVLVVWRAIRRDAFSTGGWSGVRHELSVLYNRFYSILVIGGVVFGEILRLYASGRESLAAPLHDAFVLALYSFWIPQIAKNFHADSARAFTKRYVVTMTLSRLVIPVYFAVLSSSNFLAYASAGFANVAMSPSRGIFFVSYVIGQMAVLLLQQELGAKFFVPPHLRPPRYDYFRDVPAYALRDATAASTIGSATDTTTTTSELRRRGAAAAAAAGKRSEGDIDVSGSGDAVLSSDVSDATCMRVVAQCVICMSPIETNPSDPRVRRTFMLTPCDHAFHTKCLHPWLRVKPECPTCRRRLPPP